MTGELVVDMFMTLDQVMQAPGGPDEDPSGGFAFGGWQASFQDAEGGAGILANLLAMDALLLGRRTYDIFADYWPKSPEGDPMRRFFDTIASEQDANPVFELDNRGKRAVVLDIRSDVGREALKALVATADVFLTNVRPAALARAGLSHEALRAANPRLIYCSLTGYGLEGPDADKAGMDVAAFWSRHRG